MKWNFIFRKMSISVTLDIRTLLQFLQMGCTHSHRFPPWWVSVLTPPKPRWECFQKLCHVEQGLCDLGVFTWYDKGKKRCTSPATTAVNNANCSGLCWSMSLKMSWNMYELQFKQFHLSQRRNFISDCLSPFMPLWVIHDQWLPRSDVLWDGLTRRPRHGTGKRTITLPWNQSITEPWACAA